MPVEPLNHQSSAKMPCISLGCVYCVLHLILNRNPQVKSAQKTLEKSAENPQDIGFRLDSLRAILLQEVLIQEDVELIELLDPGILSAGQTQNQQKRHLPSLGSLATPNIWELSVVFAFLSAMAALKSWHFPSLFIWGPSLLFFAIFGIQRVLRTLGAARLQVKLRKYCDQLEMTVANSRAFTNLVRKSLRLIQETEVISRGFTL
ncbi:unnamed protein product [Ranitomeya imitator]|uniref:Vezatin n=1 Tax=Ranitomeya imitator TaxID=111125 RepID=A0ABN9M2A8_9NEOB|nr:unnamed protein product [Ranitomeya imitator]